MGDESFLDELSVSYHQLKSGWGERNNLFLIYFFALDFFTE